MKEHVPIVKMGAKAKEALEEIQNNNTPVSNAERTKMRKAVSAGSKSQGILLVSALPLLKKAASTEFQRRKSWKSRVAYDDILQEAILGFLRGLLSYDETKEVSSPTNYLMQWAVTTVRRKVEALEHDFSIPYETIERTRKIIAVRSRLSGELNRTPTEEELLEAMNDTSQQHSSVGFKWGKVDKGENTGLRKQRYTLDQIKKSLELMPMLYAFGSNETTGPDSESGDSSYEQEAYSIFTEPHMGHENLINDALSEEARGEFLHTAFKAIGMSPLNISIISLFFGLDDNNRRNYTEISKELNIQPKTAKNVVAAFNEYMSRKNGIFHQLLSEVSEDELADFEFGWLTNILGNYDPSQHSDPPRILIG